MFLATIYFERKMKLLIKRVLYFLSVVNHLKPYFKTNNYPFVNFGQTKSF